MALPSCYAYTEGVDLESVQFADCYLDQANGYAPLPQQQPVEEFVSVAAGTTPMQDVTTDQIPTTDALPVTTTPVAPVEPAKNNRMMWLLGGGVLLLFLLNRR